MLISVLGQVRRAAVATCVLPLPGCLEAMLTHRPQSDPALLKRLDPGYWDPAFEEALAACVLPLTPLGEFVAHLTYGAIVTGPQPPSCPGGLPIVHQGQIAPTGVDLRQARRVSQGSPWDLPRAHLRAGDLALARSGVASVARGRCAVYLGDAPAVVGSFVDLIRLAGLDPCYALLCLKSGVVRSQVLRLINGVGTPNISFEELRSLRVPLAPAQLQADLGAGYRARVEPAHQAWLRGDEAAGTVALAALTELVETLDAAVAGRARP